MAEHTIIKCQAGTKWTAPLSTSTPDPCPTGQKMVAVVVDIPVQQTETGFDLAGNTDVFAIAFSSVLFCYMTARAIGIVIHLFKTS